MKKFIILCLSLLLIFTALPASSVLAAATPTFEAETIEGRVGDTVTVKVSTKNNSGIVSLKLLASYDSNALKLIGVTGADFDAASFSPLTSNPVVINWVDAIHPNNTTNGVVAELTFKILDTAVEGKTNINLTYNPEDVYDSNFDNVTFAVKNGGVNVLPKIVVGWHQDGSNWSYQYADGSFATNGWAEIGGKKYYFNKNGYRQTGWVQIGKVLYLFNSNGTYSGSFKCATHQNTYIAAKAATCTKAGNYAHYKCTVCGKLFNGSGKEVTATAVTLKAKHKNTYVAAKASTCTKTGNKAHYKCTVCGKRFNGAGKEITLASITIKAKHKNAYVAAKASTCTKTGNKAHYKCTVCGKRFNGAGKAITLSSVTVKPKHKNVYVAAKASTCTKTGNKAHYKCTVCGKLFNGSGKAITKASITVKPKHKNAYVARVPAKVGKTGVKAHYRCKVCGKRFNGSGVQVTLASLKIPALKK